MVNIATDAEADDHAPNLEAVRPALLLRAARAREEAIQHADKGEYDRAKEILTEIADEMQRAGLDDRDLQTEHNMLREEAMDMELGDVRYDDHTRKTATTKSFYTARQDRMYAQKVGSHQRMKMSRGAMERNAETPSTIQWQGGTLELAVDLLRIGRTPDNDIVIDEDEVSSHHCQIVSDGDDLFLEDLGSLNGTFANGGQVHDRFRLSVGDLVTVGSVLFQFTGSNQTPK
jgi:hypothetical protein